MKRGIHKRSGRKMGAAPMGRRASILSPTDNAGTGPPAGRKPKAARLSAGAMRGKMGY